MLKSFNVLKLAIASLLFLLLPLRGHASGELRATDASGKTLYAVVLSPSSQAYNGTSFAAIANANWSTYAIAMTEQGTTGIYVGSFPPSLTAPGQYGVLVYEEAAAPAAAVGDKLVASGVREWNGTSLVTLTGVSASAALLQTGQSSIIAKTNLIGTNGADSPNEVAAQGQAGANGTAIGAISTKLGTPAGGSLDADVLSRQPSGPVIATSVTNPVSLSGADETKIGLIGTDTPGVSVRLGRPAQTGDALGVVAPLIGSGKFTAAALSSTPSGGPVMVGGYAAGQDPATLLSSSFASIPAAVLARSIGHGMTVGQLLVLLQGDKVAAVTNTWNAATHTLTTAYQFSGDTAPVRSDGTVYPPTQTTAPPVISRSTTLGALPQP